MSVALYPPLYATLSGDNSNLFNGTIPTMYLSNVEGFGVSGVTVTASVQSFVVADVFAGDRVICANFPNTLEMSRFSYLCNALLGNTANTDQSGLATFPSLTFSIATLPGIYNISFTATSGQNFFEKAQQIQLRTTVATLTFSGNQPPFGAVYVTTGSSASFLPNMVVQVLDSAGKPVAGVPVRAITKSYDGTGLGNADDLYTVKASEGTSWLPDLRRGKFATLVGDTSVTDATGRAAFPQLQIVGSNNPVVYVEYLCMNLHVALYRTIIYPIVVVSPVKSVVIETQPSTSVVEGQPFATQPTIRVYDSVGSPVSNRLVYAEISYRVDRPEPLFFGASVGGYSVKNVVNAVSGFTGADGSVTFSQLALGQEGAAGQYQLVFVCDGVRSASSAMITVATSVAAVYASWPVAPIRTLPWQGDVLPIISIVDSKGQPIAGKLAEVQTDAPRIKFLTFTHPSGADGISTLGQGAILCVNTSLLYNNQFRVFFVVDGVRAAPVNVTVLTNTKGPSPGVFVEVLSYNRTLMPGQKLYMKTRLLNAQCDPVSPQPAPFWTATVQPWGLVAPVSFSTAPFNSQTMLGYSSVVNVMPAYYSASGSLYGDVVQVAFQQIIAGWINSLQPINAAGAVVDLGQSICSIYPLYYPANVELLMVFGHANATSILDDPNGWYSLSCNFTEYGYKPAYPGLYGVFAEAQGVMTPIPVQLGENPVVASLAVTTPAAMVANRTARYFQPFDIQPVVRLLDVNGQPVAGVRAVAVVVENPADLVGWAVSWTTYFLGGLGDGTRVGRVASVDPLGIGSVFSDPSNATGHAHFSNLGFVAGQYNVSSFYTIRYFSGANYGAYSNTSYDDVIDTGTPNTIYFRDYMTMKIVQQPSTSASLNVPFYQALQVQVYDSSNNLLTLGNNVLVMSTNIVATGATLVVPQPPISAATTLSFNGITFSQGLIGSSYSLTVQYPGTLPQSTTGVNLVWQASSVSVTTFPPLQVTVGSVFPMTCQAKIASGAPLPNTTVTAILVNVQLAIDALQITTVQQLFQLAPMSAVAETDQYGNAEFFLVLTSGQPGIYSLICTTGTATSLPSFPFNVTNPVSGVTIVTQPAGNHIPSAVGAGFQSQTKANRVVLLSNNASTAIESLVQPTVQVYGPVGSVVTASISLGSLALDNPESSVVDLANMAVAQLNWVNPAVSDASGLASFTDLHFTLGYPGVYRLIFICDGIPSQPSASFKLLNTFLPDTSNLENLDYFVAVLGVLTAPLLFGNLVWNPAWSLIVSITTALGIFAAVIYFLVVSLTSGETVDPFPLTLNCMAAASMLFTVVVFFFVAVRRLRPGTTDYDSRYVHARKFVKKLLNSKAAPAYWLQKEIKDERSCGRRCWNRCPHKLAHFLEHIFHFKQNRFEPFEQPEDFVWPMRFTITAVTGYYFIIVAMMGGILAVLWVQYEFNALLKSYVVAAVTLARSNQKLQETVLPDDSALNQARAAGAAVTEAVLTTVPVDFLEQLGETLYSTGMAAAVIAAACSCIIWVFMIFKYRQNAFYLRRGQFGHVVMDPSMYRPYRGMFYLGTQSVHTVLCVFVIMVIFWITFFCLFFAPARQFLTQFLGPVLVSLFGVSFGLFVLRVILFTLFAGHVGWSLKFPRVFAFLDLIYSFFGVADALFLTLLRFLIGFGVFVVLFGRMDHTILPKEIEWVDFGFWSYIGMLFVDHYHNNPTVLVAQEFFARMSLRQRTVRHIGDKDSEIYDTVSQDERRRMRARARWGIMYTLFHNKKLRMLRKRQLALDRLLEQELVDRFRSSDEKRARSKSHLIVRDFDYRDDDMQEMHVFSSGMPSPHGAEGAIGTCAWCLRPVGQEDGLTAVDGGLYHAGCLQERSMPLGGGMVDGAEMARRDAPGAPLF